MNNIQASALKEIIKIAKKHNISKEDFAQALSQEDNPGTIKSHFKVLLYIGGVLTFVGILTLLSQYYKFISPEIKVISLLTLGSILYYLLIQLAYKQKYLFTSQSLIIFSTVLISLGTLLGLSIIFPEAGLPHLSIAFLIMALQQILTFLSIRTTASLFFIILFISLSYIAVANLLNIEGPVTYLITGISYLFIASYVNNSAYSKIAPLGLLCGSLMINLSYIDLTANSSLKHSVVLLMLLQLYMGIKVQSRTLIYINGAGMALYLWIKISPLFQHSLLWLILLFILGITCILGVAFAANKKWLQNKALS